MALKVFSAEEALQNGRAAHSNWPRKASEQEGWLSPVCTPAFTPSFRIANDDVIFTVGSCFARNIEKQMSIEGFNVAVNHFAIPGEDRTGGPAAEILNKFNCFSILYELRWGLGVGPRFPEDGFHAVGAGKWTDPHLTPTIRPGTLQTVRNRRAAVETYFCRAREARIIVMTLGLAEVWFDREQQLFLNAQPFRAVAAAHPRRFELHILDYADIVNCLDEIHALLVAHGHPDFRILVTVSPVALGSSFTGNDVLIANTYSKSVQRAAVEHFVCKYDNVDYFPSYESVVLSDRKRAWREDQAHASDAIVRHNVLRMMTAYTDIEHFAAASDAAESASDHVEAARAAKHQQNYEVALLEYQKAVAVAPGEGAIAKEYGEFLLNRGRHEEALQQLVRAIAYGAGAYGAHVSLTYALLAADRVDEAYEAAVKAREMEPDGAPPMKALWDVCERMGRISEAVCFAERTIEILHHSRNLGPKTDIAKARYTALCEALHQADRAPAFFASLAVPVGVAG